MTAYSYERGHKIIIPPTEEGHDPRIANLKGVISVCCGHGVEDRYVVFDNSLTIRGKFSHIQYSR